MLSEGACPSRNTPTQIHPPICPWEFHPWTWTPSRPEHTLGAPHNVVFVVWEMRSFSRAIRKSLRPTLNIPTQVEAPARRLRRAPKSRASRGTYGRRCPTQARFWLELENSKLRPIAEAPTVEAPDFSPGNNLPPLYVIPSERVSSLRDKARARACPELAEGDLVFLTAWPTPVEALARRLSRAPKSRANRGT
jgi:hypothetical protein